MTTTVDDLLDELWRENHSSTELFVRFEAENGDELGDVVRVYRAGIQVVVVLETTRAMGSIEDDLVFQRRRRRRIASAMREVAEIERIEAQRKRRPRRSGGDTEGRAS